jgi:hypothetical protein
MDEIREADVAHRQAYQQFVLLEARPWYQQHLGRLYLLWGQVEPRLLRRRPGDQSQPLELVEVKDENGEPVVTASRIRVLGLLAFSVSGVQGDGAT